MSTKAMILTGALALVCASFAADTSDSLFMYVNAETSSFWHTAKENAFSVPIPYPEGATKAKLTVSGVQYAGQVIEGITADEVALALPAATDLPSENTYTLVLDFDKGNSVTGVVSVIDGGDQMSGIGKTRCLSTEIAVWNRMPQFRTTLPIPYGTTSLTVNGDAVDTKLGGDQGFCSVPSQSGTLVLEVGSKEYTATLEQSDGIVIIFR